MAWEEESIESGADFEEVGGKTSKLKLIIIVLIVLVLAAGGYFAYQKFFNKPPEPEQAAETDQKKAEGGETTVASDGSGGDDPVDEPEEDGGLSFRVNLEKFTINLSGSGTPHYLVCTIVLEVDSEMLKTEMTDVEDPKLYMIKTRDAILQILRAKKYEEIRDSATAREVAKEIKFRLNKIYSSGKVRNVYFSEFVVD